MSLLTKIGLLENRCLIKDGGHKVTKEDIEEMKKNDKFSYNTLCSECGSEISIKLDDVEPEEYFWISEL